MLVKIRVQFYLMITYNLHEYISRLDSSNQHIVRDHLHDYSLIKIVPLNMVYMTISMGLASFMIVILKKSSIPILTIFMIIMNV